MNRITLARMTTALLFAVAAPIVVSAQQDSAGARSRASVFDAASVASFSGLTVVRVDGASRGPGSEISVILAIGADSITAMLAPADFLASRLITLGLGDVVEIAGSKVMMGGRPVLIATEITKGNAAAVLRDKATGAPAWLSASAPPKP